MKNVGLHHKDLLSREGVPFSQEGGANAKILIFSARATKKFMSRAKTGFTSSLNIYKTLRILTLSQHTAGTATLTIEVDIPLDSVGSVD